jgi:hypothetical protein
MRVEQPSESERSDSVLATETHRYRTMYQTLLAEQLKLKKWDSVATVLDTMSNSQGLAPSLAQLMSVLQVRRFRRCPPSLSLALSD